MDDATTTSDWGLRPLLFGANRGVTRRALVLAGGFGVGLAALEYVFLLGPDNELLDALWRAFVLEADLGAAVADGTFGAFLVVGLAAIHARLNAGYLPSVALASAPVFGAAVWSLGVYPDDPEIYLDPAAAVRRTFPEAVWYATVGFLLGLGLRWLAGRLRDRRDGERAPSR